MGVAVRDGIAGGLDATTGAGGTARGFSEADVPFVFVDSDRVGAAGGELGLDLRLVVPV